MLREARGYLEIQVKRRLNNNFRARGSVRSWELGGADPFSRIECRMMRSTGQE